MSVGLVDEQSLLQARATLAQAKAMVERDGSAENRLDYALLLLALAVGGTMRCTASHWQQRMAHVAADVSSHLRQATIQLDGLQ